MDGIAISAPGGDRRPPHRTALAAVLAAAVLFGTSGTARELGPEQASALSVGAVRVAIGTLVLWLVVAFRRRSHSATIPPPTRPHIGLFALGGAGVAVYTPMFFTAVDRTGVAVGTIVTIASGPCFAAVIESCFRRHSPSVGWFVGTAVTIVGAATLVLSVDEGSAVIDPAGIVAALAAGAGYAAYSVTSKSTIERGVDSTVALAVPFTIGSVIVLTLSVGQSFAWLGTWSGFAMALYLGVMATGVAYVLFGAGLRWLSSATAVALVLAEPVTASLLAVVVLDESVPPAGWLGVVVVVAGLAMVGRAATTSGPVPQPSG